MNQHESVFNDLRGWAASIERRYKGKIKLKEKTEHILDGHVCMMSFDVVEIHPTLRAKEVTMACQNTGLTYSQDNRFFFVFDKDKRYLMLELYPYQVVQENFEP